MASSYLLTGVRADLDTAPRTCSTIRSTTRSTTRTSCRRLRNIPNGVRSSSGVVRSRSRGGLSSP